MFGTDKQCKRQEFPYCCVHKHKNDKRCGICKTVNHDVPKIVLSNCGDVMCIGCFAKNVYDI